MSLLERITTQIREFLDNPDSPAPLLTLEEFFEGNNDYGSIGCNLPDQPSPQEFYQLFRQIRSREVVQNVLVQVHSQDDPDLWPFCDTTFLVTSAPLIEVASWFTERFRPDNIDEGWQDWEMDINRASYDFPTNVRPVVLWYD
ncbi:MAG: hypothetical protein SFU83_18590 [Meiothermus sp.]|nr:hypothetical protein [Meiothermus sp.]